jgi:peroxiredoxin family protein
MSDIKSIEFPADGSKNAITLVVFSGDLDKLLAAFIIATGAAASGMQVNMFFTFWGLKLIQQEGKKARGIDWKQRMFGWMVKPGPSKREVVPLIKGGNAVNERAFERIRGLENSTHLLGFNEPERASQGNLPLEQALELWPQLVHLAESAHLRLGSPAPSSDKDGMDYFHEFMSQARRRSLRVDFIAVHWYRSRKASAFEDFIDDLAREYRLPVWITEFNGWSGPEREHYDFLKDSLRFLERDRNVERYAYFNPKPGASHSLLAADGSLTRLGELYRHAGT